MARPRTPSALCYSKGRGVTKDYVEAYKWFNLAAAKGGDLADDAKINLAMAARSLTTGANCRRAAAGARVQAGQAQGAGRGCGTTGQSRRRR